MTTTRTNHSSTHQVDIDLRTWQYDDRISLARQMWQENGDDEEPYLRALVDYVKESIGHPGPSRLALESLITTTAVCMICNDELADIRAQISWAEGGRSLWPICQGCNHETEDYSPYEIEVL